MSRTCDACGDPLDADRDRDSAGQYRDRCRPCIEAAAPDERHVDQCDAPDCAVCENYWQEYAASGGVRP